MKFLIFVFTILLSNRVYSSENLLKHIEKVELGGLDQILKTRYMRVLTTRNPYDYYIHQGKTKGIQYEMVKEFTKYLNDKYTKKNQLRIVFEMIPVDFDQLVPMLKEGKGDIIAVGMTETKERAKQIDFTVPYRIVDEVIVTREELATKPWKGKTFHVQKNSSYYNSLKMHENLVNVEQIDSNFNAGDLMQFVSLKKFDYTLVNSFWASTISKAFGNLVVLDEKPFRKGIEISWAVRKNSKKLLKELNDFLPKIKKGTLLGNMFSYKYFYDVTRIKDKNFNLSTSTISQYDKYFKKYAKEFGFDWRLVAALSFQESQFNQNIVNKWGAIGLFQIKQKTANEPYINVKNIKGEKNYENNILAGIKYMSWIKKRYFDPIKEMNEDDKIRMTLASYNAGPRRVKQAIDKAITMGLNPHKWFRNVELAMLKRGYPEPVIYVSEINKHYVSYLLLGIKD